MIEPAQSITLHGKRFVSGLFWQLLTRPRGVLQEAREIGRKHKMAVAATRIGRVLQAGFDRQAANAGAYSIASTLAGVLGDDWVGVFEVDAAADQYLIVGITKSGGIIPECDVIGSRDDIADKLNSHYNMHRFERVFCPEGFGLEGQELQLRDVITPRSLRREYKLASLGSSGSRAWWIIGLVLVIGGLVAGAFAWRQHVQAQKEAAAANAAQVAQQVAAEQTQLAAATQQAATMAQVTPHPWALQPNAAVLRQACTGAIGRTPLAMGGWLVESVDCNGTSLQLVFKRNGNATIDSITLVAARNGYQLDQIDEAGETAHLSLALPGLAAGGDDPLSPLLSVVNTVKSVFQGRQIAYSLTPKPVPPPAPVLAGEEPPPAPPPPGWQTSVLTVTGPYSPETVMADIDALPGMRLTTITVKRIESSLEWTLTGEINGK